MKIAPTTIYHARAIDCVCLLDRARFDLFERWDMAGCLDAPRIIAAGGALRYDASDTAPNGTPSYSVVYR